jgi:hypothetical protein
MKKRKKQIQIKYKKINSTGMCSIYTRTIKVFVMQCARRSEKKSEETDNKRARPIGPRMGNRVEVVPTVWLFERESAREYWRTKKKKTLGPGLFSLSSEFNLSCQSSFPTTCLIIYAF